MRETPVRTDHSASQPLQIRIHKGLGTVSASEWNLLRGDDDTFLSYEFLVALERQGCLGESLGWYPRHITICDAQGTLVGAMPMYVKTNSYGEFVFDWSWASAYEQYGMNYYPKLVISIPYTPIVGPRLLVRPTADLSHIKNLLIQQALDVTRESGFSSVHWLFTRPEDTHQLQAHDSILRLGVQYHWHNNGYIDFDHFLAGFQARKRKKVKRERQRVADQDLRLRIVHGSEADYGLWRTVHRFYVDTFDRKWGFPTLSLDFFCEIGRTMGDRLVLVLAEREHRVVACAVNFRGSDALYGRFWGCEQTYHSLHFEACYYQGIEYCIKHGLQRFEPGAQGEHKISRGFLPTRTWSAHWIADSRFRAPLADFCRREREVMEREYASLWTLSPYRPEAVPVTQRQPVQLAAKR